MDLPGGSRTARRRAFHAPRRLRGRGPPEPGPAPAAGNAAAVPRGPVGPHFPDAFLDPLARHFELFGGISPNARPQTPDGVLRCLRSRRGGGRGRRARRQPGDLPDLLRGAHPRDLAPGDSQANLRSARFGTVLPRLHADRGSTAAGRRRLGGDAGPRRPVHPGRLPRGNRHRRRPAPPVRPPPGGRRREGCGVSAPWLAAGRDGGAHSRERPAPRGRGGEGRGFRNASADGMGFRPRADGRSGAQPAARPARRRHHPLRLATRPRRGPSQASTRVLDHRPAQLHRSRGRDRNAARARGSRVPHRRPRVLEDHPLLLCGFDLCRHRQRTHFPVVRAGPQDAADVRRVRDRRARHGGSPPASGIHQQVERRPGRPFRRPGLGGGAARRQRPAEPLLLPPHSPDRGLRSRR